MFNLGFSHILLLAVIALVVVGPHQLPEMARKLARLLNDLRKAKDDILGPMTQMHADTQKMIDEATAKATQDINQLLEMRNKLDDQIRAQQSAPQPSVPKTPADQIAHEQAAQPDLTAKKDPDGKPG